MMLPFYRLLGKRRLLISCFTGIALTLFSFGVPADDYGPVNFDSPTLTPAPPAPAPPSQPSNSSSPSLESTKAPLVNIYTQAANSVSSLFPQASVDSDWWKLFFPWLVNKYDKDNRQDPIDNQPDLRPDPNPSSTPNNTDSTAPDPTPTPDPSSDPDAGTDSSGSSDASGSSN